MTVDVIRELQTDETFLKDFLRKHDDALAQLRAINSKLNREEIARVMVNAVLGDEFHWESLGPITQDRWLKTADAVLAHLKGQDAEIAQKS